MEEVSQPAKPGLMALENMKLLKKESTVFKVPKVPKKKTVKKAQVLEEEAYVEGIAKIIQRDFFPDLEKLNAQNEFLEASENKDYARLRQITQKYSGHRPPTEPYNSPATFDTPDIGRPTSPMSVISNEQPQSSLDSTTKDKEKDITDKHTLDSFLATHTSNDNASYDRLIAMEDRKRSSKLAPQFEAETTSAAMVEAALALPSIEQQADQTQRPVELGTWGYKARNYIMYVPGGAWQPAARRPGLRHRNTRLRTRVFDHQRDQQQITAIARNQGATVSGKIGVDGVSVSTEPGAPQYDIVGTPSPRPGAGHDRSPLMTWGEIEGTPFRLDGGDTPLPALGAGAAYRMLECGARERIALRLAEQAARSSRPTTPRQNTHTTPSFRSNTERLASMSPAARKLAAKHLQSPRLKLTPNDMGIFHPATPKRTPTPNRRPLVATPRNKKLATPTRPSNSGNVNAGSITENNNITDNLLQINLVSRSRLKAQDFFK